MNRVGSYYYNENIKIKKLNVTSIFLSINGECCRWGQGSWAVFVRTTGCTANCSYCDSQYSNDFTNSSSLSIAEIVVEINKTAPGIRRVVITGGEPLEQKYIIDLLIKLVSSGYEVSVETNGVHEEVIRKIDLLFSSKVSLVVDYKLPSAGHVNKLMQDETFEYLSSNSFIKFVIKDKEDFDKALLKVASFEMTTSAKMYFSPCGVEKAEELFKWMKKSNLCSHYGIGFNYQIHKNIFGKDWRDEEK